MTPGEETGSEESDGEELGGGESGDEESGNDASGDGASDRPGPGGRAARDADRPNVVVVVMDTTRAAETVPADPAVTPTLASLARSGTEFTRAFSAAPWTLPSHASLFTGTYPTNHGAHGEHTRLDGALPTLAGLFAAAGYETVGFSNNVWITEEFGFARGFDTFHENDEAVDGTYDHPDEIRGSYEASGDRPWRRRLEAVEGRIARTIEGLVPGLDRSPPDDGVERTVEWVRSWLAGRSGRDPFFLFVNCIEPHLEYRPPREHARRFLPEGWSYAEAMAVPQDPRAHDVGLFDLSEEEWSVLRGLYRAEIAYLDERLGALREALVAAGEWEDTVLVVTSDHGEHVGDHGMLGHQYSLRDALIHVPLVVHGGPFDGGLPGSDDLVGSVDLAPTLLDVAGIEAPDARAGFQGRSFHPSARTDPRSRIYAEYVAPRPPVEVLEDRFGDVPDLIYDRQRSLRALRTDRFKYVRGSDGSERLYDLAEDPGELTDLSSEAPERVGELRAALDRWDASFERAGHAGEVEVDPSTRRRLSELGYL